MEDKYAAMQEAINEAWETADPATKQAQIELTGSSEAPTPTDLIYHVIRKILKECI